jgi:hypothetical protein
MDQGFNTPILFLIFNRPETTQKVFDAIRSVKPKHLFVAADGPRVEKVNDQQNCNAARSIIKVDWNCELKKLFRTENLGCRVAVSSAIDWFFENVEEGIILEDDCLPHPDFFPFAESTLSSHRENPKVMHISGGNFQFGQKRGEASYYFSRISHIWGWATWRRAWEQYDVNMNDFPSFLKKNRKKSIFINKEVEKYWLFHFKRMYNKANTWDYQWTYAVMKKNGYCIIPNVNMISNIGFGANATHATDTQNKLANMDTLPLKSIIHPQTMIFMDEADTYTITEVFPIPSLAKRIVAKFSKILNNLAK